MTKNAIFRWKIKLSQFWFYDFTRWFWVCLAHFDILEHILKRCRGRWGCWKILSKTQTTSQYYPPNCAECYKITKKRIVDVIFLFAIFLGIETDMSLMWIRKARSVWYLFETPSRAYKRHSCTFWSVILNHNESYIRPRHTEIRSQINIMPVNL